MFSVWFRKQWTNAFKELKAKEIQNLFALRVVSFSKGHMWVTYQTIPRAKKLKKKKKYRGKQRPYNHTQTVKAEKKVSKIKLIFYHSDKKKNQEKKNGKQ